MNKLAWIFTILLLSITVLTSCGNFYRYNQKRTISLTPDYVRLNVDINDLEYLGKTEISVDSRKYLGVIKVVDSVNNQAYNYQDVRITKLNGPRNIKLQRQMKKAAYKVVDEYPEATFYLIANEKKEVSRMFLGRKTDHKMEIQAYKYKIEQN